jgi:hypothetical protein
MFVLGFQQELLDRVAHRLQSMNPDTGPEEGFSMRDIYKVALTILQGSTFFHVELAVPSVRLDNPLASSAPSSCSVPASATQPPTIVKQEDIYAMLGQLMQTLNIQWPSMLPVVPQPPPAPQPFVSTAPVPSATSTLTAPAALPCRPSETERCNFCSEIGHFMGSCPTAEQYLQTGRATRRPDGKLGLPNGQFIPRSIKGQWLKDRLDEYWRCQLGDQTNVNLVTPANPPTATHSATIVPPPLSGTAASMIFGIGPSASQEDVLATKGLFMSMVSIQDNEDAQEEIEYYQNQILAIQMRQRTKKMAFDSVEIVKKSAPQPATSTKQNEPSSSRTEASVTNVLPPPSKGKEKEVPAVPTPVPEKPVETKQPTSPPMSTLTAPVHPFSKAKDANYLPPVDRNFAAALKPKERDAACHTSAPIQDSKFVDSVLDRSLKETHIMLSFEELLSLSPDLHYHLCDKVKPKCQTPTKAVHFVGEELIDIEQIVSPAALQDLEPTQLGPNCYQAPDLAQVFYMAQDCNSRVQV